MSLLNIAYKYGIPKRFFLTRPRPNSERSGLPIRLFGVHARGQLVRTFDMTRTHH